MILIDLLTERAKVGNKKLLDEDDIDPLAESDDPLDSESELDTEEEAEREAELEKLKKAVQKNNGTTEEKNGEKKEEDKAQNDKTTTGATTQIKVGIKSHNLTNLLICKILKNKVWLTHN